jgi:hypothetical protein
MNYMYCQVDDDDDDDDDNINDDTETCMSMYVGISEDKNVTMKGTEKIMEYKNLTIVIQRVRIVKT